MQKISFSLYISYYPFAFKYKTQIALMRYYNLKIGNPRANGGLLVVDASASPDSRLRNYALGEECSDYSVEMVSSRDGSSIFRLVDQPKRVERGAGRDALGGKMGLPVAFPVGRANVLELETDSAEILRVHRNSGNTRVTIREITAQEARDAREAARCWALQRAYVYE